MNIHDLQANAEARQRDFERAFATSGLHGTSGSVWTRGLKRVARWTASTSPEGRYPSVANSNPQPGS
jgi:hypothetical protein